MFLRTELLMLLLAGFAGGLTGTLWGGIVSSALLAGQRSRQPQAWQPDTASRLLAGALSYGLCGAAAGFLFWLGWGLVALVAIEWPLVGLLYGGLLWAAGALPTLGMLWLRLNTLRAALLVQMLESLVACMSIGLLCAFAWYRSG
jgi:hypothetical protein